MELDMSGATLRQVGNGVQEVTWQNRHFAEFFHESVRMGKKSEDAGRDVYEEVEYIRIQFPGDKTKVIARPATDQDKALHPQQWAQFKASHEQTPEGMPLKQWPLCTKSDVLNLAYQKVQTVEQLAGLSDAQLQNIGVGYMGLRDKAKAWLAAAKDAEPLAKLMARIEALETDNAALKNQLTAKRGPGRPPKEQEDAS